MLYINPEFGTLENFAGILFIIVGALCINIHMMVNMNRQTQNNDLVILAKNYDDFSMHSTLRESLHFKQDNADLKVNKTKKQKLYI